MNEIAGPAHLVESGIFIAWITLTATTIGAISTIRIARPRRLVLVGIPQVGIPLHEARPHDWPDVIPSEPGKDYEDLQVVKVQLRTGGRWDIASSAFDQDLPITIDVGVPILTMRIDRLLDTDTPYLKAEIAGTELKVGPSLLRPHETWTFVLLTNGRATLAIRINPLVDIKILKNTEQRRRQLKYLVVIIILSLIALRSGLFLAGLAGFISRILITYMGMTSRN
jgi:hypothetical protein